MSKINIPITDKDTLIEFYDKCVKEKVLAIDTEFIRDNTYYPCLCLIQIAGSNFSATIDPLSDLDLTPIWKLLSNEKILKVLHAGRQDIEIFFYLTGKIPKPIYDTQIASMFCGFGDQVGYEHLVNNFLGITISLFNTRKINKLFFCCAEKLTNFILVKNCLSSPFFVFSFYNKFITRHFKILTD